MVYLKIIILTLFFVGNFAFSDFDKNLAETFQGEWETTQTCSGEKIKDDNKRILRIKYNDKYQRLDISHDWVNPKKAVLYDYKIQEVGSEKAYEQLAKGAIKVITIQDSNGVNSGLWANEVTRSEIRVCEAGPCFASDDYRHLAAIKWVQIMMGNKLNPNKLIFKGAYNSQTFQKGKASAGGLVGSTDSGYHCSVIERVE